MVANRLALKILALLAAAALAVTALGWVYLSFEEARIVRTEETRLGSLLIQTIDQGMQAAMLAGRKDVARHMVDDLVKVGDIVNVSVFWPDGKVWHSSKGKSQTPAAPSELVRQVAGSGRAASRFERRAGTEVFLVLSPINNQQACHRCHASRAPVLGVTVVTLSTVATRDRVATDRRLLIGTNLAVVGFSILVLGAALAVVVVRPIQRLSGVAEAIADGNMDLRADHPGGDEIGDLARAFNAMTDRLQTHIADLETTRAELQETIERVGEAISSAHRLEDLVDVLAREALGISKSRAASVMLFSDAGELVVRGARGTGARDVAAYNRRPLRASDPIVVEQAKRPLACVKVDRGAEPERARFAVLGGAKWHLAVPLTHERKVLGFLSLAWTGAQAELSSDATRLLGALASQVAVAIQQIHLHEQTQVLAITDGLTALYNHRYFQERLASELHRAQRFDHPLALIMLDVDRFKAYNDRHGHLAGDAVLAAMGALLREDTRRVDVAARYGGEEFTVILVETGHEEALAYAERLRASVEGRRLGQDAPGGRPITVSLGVAAYPMHAQTPETLIQAADEALYEAKAKGRNQVAGARSPIAER